MRQANIIKFLIYQQLDPDSHFLESGWTGLRYSLVRIKTSGFKSTNHIAGFKSGELNKDP